MTEGIEMFEEIKQFLKENNIKKAANIIGKYLNESDETNYIDRLEKVIETVNSLAGGRAILKYLIENLMIDIPYLLEQLSHIDHIDRFTTLLLLKNICEEECGLFIPFSEQLIKDSKDPNVREMALQLLIFVAGGEKQITRESLIESIALKLIDEEDYVIQKAIQALISIGKRSPSIVTEVLTKMAQEIEDKDLKERIDKIVKSIATIDREVELKEREKELEEKEKNLEFKEAELEVKEILTEYDISELEVKERELTKKDLELREKAADIILQDDLEIDEETKKLKEEE
ncbi:MAG: hypothetical protein ACFFAT_19800, partial [Promethearchaeota archaeon]